jgi:hypothetical protein
MNFENKLSGFAFPVRTKRLGGGTPMLTVWGVRLSDEGEARKQLIMKQGFDASEVGDAYPISAETFNALGFDNGDDGMF